MCVVARERRVCRAVRALANMFLITASELRDIIATAKAESTLAAEARLREEFRRELNARDRDAARDTIVEKKPSDGFEEDQLTCQQRLCEKSEAANYDSVAGRSKTATRLISRASRLYQTAPTLRRHHTQDTNAGRGSACTHISRKQTHLSMPKPSMLLSNSCPPKYLAYTQLRGSPRPNPARGGRRCSAAKTHGRERAMPRDIGTSPTSKHKREIY